MLARLPQERRSVCDGRPSFGVLLLASAAWLLACGGNHKAPESAGNGKVLTTRSADDASAGDGAGGAPPQVIYDESRADDPHEAALMRLLNAPWGARNDKDDQVHVPTPDWEAWKRVRFWGLDHFTGFKYGKDHHVVAAVFVQDVPAGTPVRSETCMRRFEAWGRPQIKAYDVKFGEFTVNWSKWRNQPLMISQVDGQLNWALSRIEFSAAWAAYPAYPNACLIYAVGVPWRDDERLAKKLRERWVAEGFVNMNPLTAERPYRKP